MVSFSRWLRSVWHRLLGAAGASGAPLPYVMRTGALSRLLFSGLLLLVLLPGRSSATERIIEGRVFSESGPLPGSTVSAYRTYEGIRTGRPAASDTTDEKGTYLLRLPDGEYYVVARAARDGVLFHAYHGGNPVTLGRDNLWVSFMVNPAKPAVTVPGKTSVRGVVTYKGAPVRNAKIAFYSPESKQFKGLGFRTETAHDGTFNIPLSAGAYVIIARKTEVPGNSIRPLRNGELFCYYAGNPVTIETDRVTQIEVPCYPKNDRMSFVQTPMIKSNDYPTTEDSTAGKAAGLKGMVFDAGRKPVPSVYVVAYRVDPGSTMDVFTGTHETKSIARTDERGRFFVPLTEDGNYSLIVRERLGSGPEGLELYGLYRGESGKGISFKRGQVIKGIGITVQGARAGNDER